jgi:hypothetical protein
MSLSATLAQAVTDRLAAAMAAGGVFSRAVPVCRTYRGLTAEALETIRSPSIRVGLEAMQFERLTRHERRHNYTIYVVYLHPLPDFENGTIDRMVSYAEELADWLWNEATGSGWPEGAKFLRASLDPAYVQEFLDQHGLFASVLSTEFVFVREDRR